MARPSRGPGSAAPGSSPRPSLDPRAVRWPLVFALGVVGLIRPVASIAGIREVIDATVAAVGLTVVVSLIWILVVGLSRVPQPFLTLVFTGLAYGAYTIVLSAILSPLLEGELMGPVANPFAIVAVLVSNAIWGGVCGLLALLVRRLRR